jgi:hypothetical protein
MKESKYGITENTKNTLRHTEFLQSNWQCHLERSEKSFDWLAIA